LKKLDLGSNTYAYIAKVEVQAAACEEAAHAVVEKLMQEQWGRDVIAVQF